MSWAEMNPSGSPQRARSRAARSQVWQRIYFSEWPQGFMIQFVSNLGGFKYEGNFESVTLVNTCWSVRACSKEPACAECRAGFNTWFYRNCIIFSNSSFSTLSFLQISELFQLVLSLGGSPHWAASTRSCWQSQRSLVTCCWRRLSFKPLAAGERTPPFANDRVNASRFMAFCQYLCLISASGCDCCEKPAGKPDAKNVSIV